MTNGVTGQECGITGCYGLNAITPPLVLAEPNHNDAKGKETQPGIGETATKDNEQKDTFAGFVFVIMIFLTLWFLTKEEFRFIKKWRI